MSAVVSEAWGGYGLDHWVGFQTGDFEGKSLDLHQEAQASIDYWLSYVHDVQFSSELYTVGGEEEAEVDRG